MKYVKSKVYKEGVFMANFNVLDYCIIIASNSNNDYYQFLSFFFFGFFSFFTSSSF